MPNTLVWRGDAKPVPQVTKVTFGNIEEGDTFTLTINRKTASYTVVLESTDTTAQLILERTVTGVISAIGAAALLNQEWQEITPTATYDAAGTNIVGVTLTGPSDGKPFTVTGTTGDAGNLAVNVATIQAGSAGYNEKQRVTIPGTATGGTFTLTFDGQTTGAIAYNASAATVETALEGLSNVTAGDVAVTGDAGGPWTVEFAQNYANEDVALMTGDGSSITKGATDFPIVVNTVREAVAGQNETQAVWLEGSPSSGTFTLTFQGETTGTIAYNAAASTVQSALEALSGVAVGDVEVLSTQTGLWYVTFKGAYLHLDVEQMEGDGSSLGGMASVVVATTTQGAPATNEVQHFLLIGDVELYFYNPIAGGAESVVITDGALATADDFRDAVVGAISFLTVDNFIVTGTKSVGYYCQWTNDLGGRDITTTGTVNLPGGWSQVTVAQNGGTAAVNEVQRVRLAGGPVGGTFTLSFRGQTTAAIAYNATAADVKSALEAISTITAVAVTGANGGPWDVTFSDPGAEDVPTMTGAAGSLTGGTVSIVTVTAAVSPVNEVQKITVNGNPAGGTFTLTHDGNTTGALTFDDTAADVEAALDGLASINDCEVTGADGGPWQVEFKGADGGVNMEQISGDGSSLSGAAVQVEVLVASAPKVNEVQTVTLGGAPSGGTFTMTWDSQTTGNIVYNASAESVKLALEALSNIDIGEVAVGGGAGGPWTVTFQSGLGGADQSLITGNATNLTSSGTQTITVTASTTPTGPNWFNEADNWHNPAVPATAVAPADGDTLWFADSDVACLYGLDANSGDTFAAIHVKASYTASIGLETHNGYYWEYRVLALTAGVTALTIGEGDGSGSGRLRFDLESVASTIQVYRTATSTGDLPSFVYKGGAATTTLAVYRGSVGIALACPGDTANCQTLTVGYVDSPDSDAEVYVGAGCAAITTVNKSGGSVEVEGVNVTTLTQDAGTFRLSGAATLGTLKANGGTIYYASSGTLTAAYLGSGSTLDFRAAQKSRTVTNCTINAGAALYDSFQTVTWTNPITYDRCSMLEVEVDLGTHITVAATGA